MLVPFPNQRGSVCARTNRSFRRAHVRGELRRVRARVGFAHRSRSNERRPGGLYDDERSQAGAARPILGRGHAVA